jgi:D-serine deaminase-like pyridoxal phosphate-dependent protein
VNEAADYQLTEPESVLSPCLLVYPDLIRSNLAESIRMAGATSRLRPHVKTHKTPQIVQLATQAGIYKHKCATLAEAHMLAECGVQDVLVAYPQVGPSVGRFVEIVCRFPGTRFSVVVDDPACLQALADELELRDQSLDVLMDIDTGMHRTGIPAGSRAIKLYEQIHQSPRMRPAGFHVYDGQNHQPDLGERRDAVTSLMQPVLEMATQLKMQGIPVPTLVCGGTPTFPVFAEFDLPDTDTQVECSPGTCVLSDFNYGRDYAEMSGIRPAAVLMTRVISRHQSDRVTVDLGYKAVASDPPAGRRCHFLNLPEAREIQHSEEHLVLESPHAYHLSVGDVLYALPAHICPTVALHSHLQVVEQGRIVDRWKVAARDRLY